MPPLRLILAYACLSAALAAQTPSGEEVYKQRCAGCHSQDNPRIPPRTSLEKMPASHILRTLNYGAMLPVAYTMSMAEREAVSKYLGVAGGDAPMPASAFCRDRAVKIAANTKVQWNGWSPTTDNWRYQSADAAGLTLDGVKLKRLKFKWAFALAGDVTAFAQPTILDNDLFMGSASGETTHRAAAVELLRHRNEADASLVEHLHNTSEVQQRTAEPVDLVHHHAINASGFHVGQQLPQPGPVGVGSREAAIVIAVRQHRPTFVTLAQDISFRAFPLGIERVELLFQSLIRGLPGIDGTTHRPRSFRADNSFSGLHCGAPFRA